MCYTGRCPNEDYNGECRRRPYGVCPDDEDYGEQEDARKWTKEQAADAREEAAREQEDEDND
jgi:hypothetical protein